jgi:crossover junction endodeoxyribonuclease RuvC
MRVKNLAELEKILARKQVLQRNTQPQTKDNTPLPQLRIIGLDVALRCTGWGIIDTKNEGNVHVPVDCGVIKTDQKAPVSECLRRLAGGVRELIELYKPDVATIEGGFYCQNVRTAIILGAARGAVIATLAEKSIPTHEYAPRKVKQAICGLGNASKQQVALLVSQMLRIQTDALALDSTDALAMALTHAQLLSVAQGFGIPDPI